MNQPNVDEARVMTILLTARPGKQEELIQALESLTEEVRAQAGCQDCMIGQDLGNGSRFLLYLLWKDLASLHTYIASDGFRVLLGAHSTLADPGEFRFNTSAGDCTRSSGVSRPAPASRKPLV